MRYELSINVNYVPNWSITDGIRELLQNAKDAEVEFDAKMSVEHVARVRAGKKLGTLIICNEGCTLSKEALLLGTTSKAGRS